MLLANVKASSSGQRQKRQERCRDANIAALTTGDVQCINVFQAIADAGLKELSGIAAGVVVRFPYPSSFTSCAGLV